jgi:hypothetical protein
MINQLASFFDVEQSKYPGNDGKRNTPADKIRKCKG